ncbi:CLUMA_CG021336, isoform A [Clunio marinus]|uniref:Indole-3-acetaldehyde oxidase n=1 Tax=Clunio marinus TaxID=568069 RepID=A0A1J1J883_9DIPT|nr:CLUMA_CG021336, isoform A [Clunio marinus]
MCLEGGCGACVVTLKGVHPVTKEKTTWAVNSCLQNIYSCHGLDIITVEGIGSKKNGMHQVQKRLANFNGTQCGYCSPGMVMNMYSLLESKNGKVTMEEVENSFGGNICRCTGYRPILDAFKSLASDADETLLNLCKDIEDLDGTKTCPKTGTPCIGSCSAIGKVDPKHSLKLTFEDDREWHKIYNLTELFKVMGTIGYRPYQLVAGNPAHGVYRRSADLKVFIDISSVEELRGFKVNDNTLEIGGNVTLTEAMEIFTKVANEKKGFESLKEFVTHIDLIANVPVRNNGTIAGNLALKYANLSFPSDVFVVLEAVGAKIVLFSGAQKQDEHNPLAPSDFLNVSMRRKVIGKIIFPSLSSSFVFRSYKIMPRAQNAHSYVNAAFLLQFNEEKTFIKSASICFGGIDDFFDHAEKLEKFLIGKDIYLNEVLQNACEVLEKEIKPDSDPSISSPEFRKHLAISLFYKFVLNTSPSDKVKSEFKLGGETLKREISSGQQQIDVNEGKSKLYKRIPKVEADIQCTGEAQYVNDIPKFENELHAAFVLGDKVNGRIKSIDASEALNISGVVAFYAAKDIPGLNNFMPLRFKMFNLKIEEVFCRDKLLYHGQPVGIVLAETFDLAYKARKFIKIDYSFDHDDEPIYPTIREVMKAKADDRLFDVPEYYLKASEYGNDKQHKISGHFEIPSTQYHYSMETQQCLVVPSEDDCLDVYSSAQWSDTNQISIAEVLNIPVSNVNTYVRRLGGAFGGKISRQGQIACAAALGSYLTKKPVRLIMSMEDNMRAIGKRFSSMSDYVAEVDNLGKIQTLKHHYIHDQGCSPNEVVQFNTSVYIGNCYNIKSWDVTTQSALTHSASNTWMRAPGTTDAIAMTEHVMEHIARVVGRDPIDVRMENLEDGSEFKTMIPTFINDVKYRERKAAIDKFNLKNRWVKRGIAVSPMKYFIAYFGSMHGIVSIYHGDGSVALSTGGVEMGQGLNTKVMQVASHVLGIPFEKISIKPSNSLNNANDIGSVASVTSEVACYIVKKCCEILMERMKPFKDENPEASWEEIVENAFLKNTDLSATYMYKQEEMETYYVYGLSCAEVEVDLLTGNILLKRVDILEDTGESMSPGIDIGQIEGGFVMGLGIWLTENLIYDPKTAELLTDRSWNYKPPGAKDIPIDFRIKLVQKKPNPCFVLRSKAVGEPPVTMGVVVSFAIRHAIDSARKDNGCEDLWYVLSPPISPEKIILAAGLNIKDFKLN